MKLQKTTIENVAKYANVSTSTVSRILNGTVPVSETKQKAVQQAIETLGFQPDPVARSLASGRTLSIGVLTQFIDSPYYGEALRGIETALMEAEYVPLFVSGHWNKAEEHRQILLLKQRKVDAIILLTARLSDDTLYELAAELPIVITGRHIQGHNLVGLDFDNIQGAHLATQHLIDLGHARIAFITGPDDHPDSVDRLQGFYKTMQQNQIPIDPSLIYHGNFQESGGYQAAHSLISARKHFSAIICANDQMAYGAQLALARSSFRVPDDVSLIGFDDLPHSAFTLPPLSSVKQSIFNVGKHAADLALSMLREETLPPQKIVSELIVRESTRRLS